MSGWRSALFHQPSAPDLEAHLAEVVRQARATWPDLAVTEESFLRHLASKLTPGAKLPSALDALHTADLYLAPGCAQKDAAALRAFDSHFLRRVVSQLTRAGVADGVAQDVSAHLAEYCVVARGKPSPLLGFGGRAELSAWLRVAALRIATRHTRRGQQLSGLDERAVELGPLSDDVELNTLREAAREAFADAFARGAQALTPRQRNLLRQSFVDKLSIDKLARLYSVHRATAARWVAQARGALIEATHHALSEQGLVDPRDSTSVVRLIESGFNVSVERLLAS